MAVLTDTIEDNCPYCSAKWAAATLVNTSLDAETLRQLATPRKLFACGTTFHPDDHAEYEVLTQVYQTPACKDAELLKHRGG